MKETDPDVELLARIGHQDPTAVNEMVSRKLPRLLALASRILGDADEARDIAQETFLRIWRQAANWRSGEARFDTWVHRVALNLCRDHLRRRKERPLNENEDMHEVLDSTPTPDEQLEATARSEQMAAALASLPDRQREAIVLQYYQELSNIDAAALMNISVEALESLLSRARRNLRSYLAETPGHARPGRGT